MVIVVVRESKTKAALLEGKVDQGSASPINISLEELRNKLYAIIWPRIMLARKAID